MKQKKAWCSGKGKSMFGCINPEQKKVYLVCGLPGAGKSTWIKKYLAVPGVEWISRDNVRFSIVSENEEYFSHEDEVFDTFINYINQSLENDNLHTIFIDATHLNERSRRKTLSHINHNYINELNCIYFTTPAAICEQRNNQRQGRSKVPTTVIYNMSKSYYPPTKKEGFTHIYKVNENNEIKEVCF